MGEKLPRLIAKEIIAVVEKLGFSFSRQSGSHKIYRNQKGQRVTIPYHGNKILHPKLLKSIMRDAELTFDKLNKLL